MLEVSVDLCLSCLSHVSWHNMQHLHMAPV